jgi:hypothetical protein
MAVAANVSVDPVLAEILLGSCRALVDEADDILERARWAWSSGSLATIARLWPTPTAT